MPPDVAVKQLEDAHRDLMRLSTLVGSFVDWWISMRVNLESLEIQMPFISSDNPLRTQIITMKWEDVKSRYVWYAAEVGLCILIRLIAQPIDAVNRSGSYRTIMRT